MGERKNISVGGASTEDTNNYRYVGMTLEEVVDLLGGTNIKLGTAGGSGFIYCGKASDLEVLYEAKDEVLIDRLDKAHKNAQANLSKMINEGDGNVSAYLKKMRSVRGEEDMTPTLEDYLRYVNDCFDKVKKRSKRITERRESRAAFKPLRERIVKRAYPSIAPWEEKGTMILLVAGTETGDPWDLEEYETGHIDKGGGRRNVAED